MSDIRTLVVPSVGRAGDAAHLAAADVAAVAAALDLEFRLVGGHAVSLLTWVYDVEGLVPGRETADADMGADGSYLAHPTLLPALKKRGYTQKDGSRFVRSVEWEDGPLDLIIDVLAPSRTGKFENNQSFGDLVVDEPGPKFGARP